jgi:hypothetical protein
MFVLLITREDSTVERVVLSPEDQQALVRDVTRRLTALRAAEAAVRPPPTPAAGGAGDSARRDSVGPRARDVQARSRTDASQFTVPQVLLTGLATGPALAYVISDLNISPAAYLGSLGLTFLATRAAAPSGEVDRLAAAGANINGFLGAVIGATAGAAVSQGEVLTSMAYGTIAGGIAGSAAGFAVGGTASPADIRAMIAGPFVGIAAGLAIAGAQGTRDGMSPDGWRTRAGWAAAGGLLGSPAMVGVLRRYAGRLTEGDVDALVPIAAGGAITGAWLASLGQRDIRVDRALVGGGVGYLAGTVLAMRGVALRFDLTQPQALGYVGAVIAGGRVGALAYTGRGPTSTLGGTAVGAISTLLAIHSVVKLKPDGALRTRIEGYGARPSPVAPQAVGDTRQGRGPARVQLDPGGVLFAALRMPGMFPVLRATF